MGSYLLDTCAFVKLVQDPKQFRGDAATIVNDESNDLYLSAASLWELAIKHSQGTKVAGPTGIPFDTSLLFLIKESGVKRLPIQDAHLLYVAQLAYRKIGEHRFTLDPFDRLILSQAHIEKLPLITSDRKMDDYGVKLIRM